MQTWKNELGHVCFSSRHKHTGDPMSAAKCQNPNGIYKTLQGLAPLQHFKYSCHQIQNTARPLRNTLAYQIVIMTYTYDYSTHYSAHPQTKHELHAINKQNMNYRQSSNKTDKQATKDIAWVPLCLS